jgi:DNA mismatch endonuclease, patch repair protein
MADVFTRAKRSEIMARIKGKNTKPEIRLKKLLRAAGIRYRSHVKNLPGTPDVVLPELKTAIFVHGCFWHGHKGCRRSRLPSTNRKFWKKKIDGNILRDQKKALALKMAKWNVKIFWSCKNITAFIKKVGSISGGGVYRQ